MWRWLLAIGLVGCGGEASAPSRPEADPAATAGPAEPAEPAPPSSAWPSRVRSLREAVDDFTTVEACREELRGRTPTAVAEGLADLHYDGFFDDVCAGLAAVKEGDVAACDAIDPSATRAGCRRRLAMVQGDPNACPDDRVVAGRDAVCVAWAARAPTLCRAAASPDDVRCRAVLAGEAEACARLRGGDDDRCRAEVARYASALGDERVEHALPDALMELELTAPGAEAETITREALARGVFLRASGCRWQIALERPQGESGLLSLGAGRQGTFRLEVTVPAGSEPPASLPLGEPSAVLTVRSPSRGGLTSISGASGQVTLERFEPERGGVLEGTIEGALRTGTETIQVRGRFATFVRDLEAMDPACDRDEAP